MNYSSNIVKIAGGGIAGLTAGIQLKIAGFAPIIYEQKSIIGSNRHGDYEGLENWIFEQSMSNFFEQSGFDFNLISAIPIHEFQVHTATLPPFWVRHDRPLFHMIRRGPEPSDLDSELYHQCIAKGVNIVLGEKAPEDCDIIATGTAKAAAYIRGYNFKSSESNQVHLLLGYDFSPKGYAYLIILNGRGTLAVAYKKSKGNHNNFLDHCKNYFCDYGIRIPNGNLFASRGSFSLPIGGMKHPFKIGEAGGYQDYLFGFGIRMSMISGKIAALALLGRNKEARLLIKNVNRKRRLSFINRILYERLNDEEMSVIAKKISKSSDPLSILSNAYSWNFKNVKRWVSMKYRHEVRPS